MLCYNGVWLNEALLTPLKKHCVWKRITHDEGEETWTLLQRWTNQAAQENKGVEESGPDQDIRPGLRK